MKNKQLPTMGQAIMNLIVPYELLVKYEALGQEFDIGFSKCGQEIN